MKYTGAHISISGGIEFAPVNAHEIGANASVLFAKDQYQQVSKPPTEDSVRLFKEDCEKFGFAPEYILPHDNCLINLGHPEEEGLSEGRAALPDEMQRYEQLGLKLLDFHSGSHLDKTPVEGYLDRIVESINLTLEKTQGITAVIESIAGQGSNLENKFRQLKYIIDHVEGKSRVGVCLDTCHIFTAGYDFLNNYDNVFGKFGEVIGFEYLRGIHPSDSERELGSRIDRHDNTGKGLISFVFFEKLMEGPHSDNAPLILETINETLWPKKITRLREQAQ